MKNIKLIKVSGEYAHEILEYTEEFPNERMRVTYNPNRIPGLDYLEDYVRQVREVIGYTVPLAIDHFGHVAIEDAIRFAKRLEKYKKKKDK